MTITMENRRESYEKVNKLNRYTQIMDVFITFNRATAEAISNRTGIELYQVRPRLTELVQAGKLKVTGKAPSFKTGRDTAIFEIV